MQGLLPKFHPHLQHFDLTSTCWAHLTDCYAARDRSWHLNIDHGLQEFKITEHGDLTFKMAEYRRLVTDFATTGTSKFEDDQVTFLLNKLPPKYFNFM